jgi:multiple sugar transport system substrate-binding protein
MRDSSWLSGGAYPAVALAGVAALVTAACAQSSSSSAPKAGGPVTISLAVNAVLGGKNAQEASWLHDWAIPTFEQQEARAGKKVTLNVQYSSGSEDSYAKQLALDLQAKSGPDAFDIDGFYVGDFAASGYLKPLDQVPGHVTDGWDGWAQIPRTVQANLMFNGQRYGIPTGTDGRVLFYNKDVFQKAGLPADWHPKSWSDILSAARTIRAREPDVTPLQINAGANDNFGEATTLQGYLPFLAGAGKLIYDDRTKKWQGNTPAQREALGFFQTVYGEGLGSRSIQVNPQGRTVSFQQFAAGRTAVVLESEYLYESVLAPDGLAPMANRDSAVGYTLIPSMKPGTSFNGKGYVSLSGGGGRSINPYTKHPNEAWDLLTFLESKQAVDKYLTYEPIITARQDSNASLTDPLLKFIANQVLPYTAYRPSAAVYPQVSTDIQAMVQSVAEGQASPAQAAQTFSSQLAGLPDIGPGRTANS